MKHAVAQELLNDYLDRALAPAQLAAVDAHLAQCAECREELSRLRALVARAAQLAPEIPPERELWPEIARRMNLPAERNGLRDRLSRALRPGRPALWPALGMGAAVLAVLLIANLRQVGPPSRTPAADPASLAVVAALEAECRQGDAELRALEAAGHADTGGSAASVLRDNLRIVNQAVIEARDAWTANPDCPQLVRLLTAAYQAKAVLQGRTIRLAGQV